MSRKWPTEAHPTSEAGGDPDSDDKTVAKMGHPVFVADPDVGHPPHNQPGTDDLSCHIS